MTSSPECVTLTLIAFDPQKHRLTLLHRGLDMARAEEVFAGDAMTREDDRADYGETRFITVGYLDERMTILVWTWRGDTRRIISMRKANGREQKYYGARMGQA